MTLIVIAITCQESTGKVLTALMRCSVAQVLDPTNTFGKVAVCMQVVLVT